MTALEMQHDICRRIIEECHKQTELRDSLPENSIQRREASLILEGMLRAAQIATY